MRTFTGYSSVREDPVIVELAKKYKVSPTQIILSWHLVRNTVIVPKSENEERQKENIKVRRFCFSGCHLILTLLFCFQLLTLAAEDAEKISGLDRGLRLCNAPDKHGQVCGWTLEQMGW